MIILPALPEEETAGADVVLTLQNFEVATMMPASCQWQENINARHCRTKYICGGSLTGVSDTLSEKASGARPFVASSCIICILCTNNSELVQYHNTGHQ